MILCENCDEPRPTYPPDPPPISAAAQSRAMLAEHWGICPRCFLTRVRLLRTLNQLNANLFVIPLNPLTYLPRPPSQPSSDFWDKDYRP